jgi:hypothetical protein
LSAPYRYFSSDEGYSFVTDFGVEYRCYFIDYSFLIEAEDLKSIRIRSFNIEPTSRTSHLKLDPKVKETVKEIILDFFRRPEDVLVYICDSVDQRQMGRARKFDSWFRESEINTIEKYDFKSNSEGAEILNSILIHREHPSKIRMLEEWQKVNNQDTLK